MKILNRFKSLGSIPISKELYDALKSASKSKEYSLVSERFTLEGVRFLNEYSGEFRTYKHYIKADSDCCPCYISDGVMSMLEGNKVLNAQLQPHRLWIGEKDFSDEYIEVNIQEL